VKERWGEELVEEVVEAPIDTSKVPQRPPVDGRNEEQAGSPDEWERFEPSFAAETYETGNAMDEMGNADGEHQRDHDENEAENVSQAWASGSPRTGVVLMGERRRSRSNGCRLGCEFREQDRSWPILRLVERPLQSIQLSRLLSPFHSTKSLRAVDGA
jgi:hypothetical protein